MAVDEQAREEAAKGLIVCFIIGTIASNLGLAVWHLRVPRFLTLPNVCCRLASSCGCLFLAVFSYLGWARFIYNQDLDGMSCSTVVLMITYHLCFLPFVFGCSLVAQGLYARFGHRLPLMLNPMVKSFLLVSGPWLLGLVIVCPLSLDGMTGGGDQCYSFRSLKHYRSIVIVCVVAPAILSFLVNLVLRCSLARVGPNYSELENPDEIIQEDHDNLIQQHGSLSAEAPMRMHDANESPKLPAAAAQREISHLLGTSSLLCVSVLPLAFFALVYYLNEDRDTTLCKTAVVALNDTFFWMFALYPCLAPLLHFRFPKF